MCIMMWELTLSRDQLCKTKDKSRLKAAPTIYIMQQPEK